METLFYADEIKDADPLFSAIADEPADAELLAVAEQLIARKTAPFDAAAFTDNYDKALRALIEDKRKGRAPRVTAEGSGRASADNVVDLMQALKESLKASGGAEPARGKAKASARKTAARKADPQDEAEDKPAPRRSTRKAG